MSKSSRDSTSAGYFNNIFKSHLYYKRSNKDTNDANDMNNNNKGTDYNNDDGFIYPSQGPPKSSGSSIFFDNTRHRQDEDDSENNSSLSFNKNEPENQLIQPSETISNVFQPKKIYSLITVVPKFYENGESTLIRRGKFKGKYDDRQVRCLYFLDKSSKDHKKVHIGCANSTSKKCYCSHVPIVKSPLRNVVNYSDFENFICDAKTGLNPRAMTNRYDMSPVDSKRNAPAHLMSKVRQRFNGDYEFNNKTEQRVRKIHSLNNIRKFGYAKPTQGQDTPDLIHTSSMRNIVLKG